MKSTASPAGLPATSYSRPAALAIGGGWGGRGSPSRRCSLTRRSAVKLDRGAEGTAGKAGRNARARGSVIAPLLHIPVGTKRVLSTTPGQWRRRFDPAARQLRRPTDRRDIAM